MKSILAVSDQVDKGSSQPAVTALTQAPRGRPLDHSITERLLAALRENPSASVLCLARVVGASPTTIRARLDELPEAASRFDGRRNQLSLDAAELLRVVEEELHALSMLIAKLDRSTEPKAVTNRLRASQALERHLRLYRELAGRLASPNSSSLLDAIQEMLATPPKLPPDFEATYAAVRREMAERESAHLPGGGPDSGWTGSE